MPPIDLKKRRADTRRTASASQTSRLPILDPDEDAPEAEHHELATGQVLASALRNVEQGSEAEKALLAVVDLLVAKHGDSGGGNGHSGLTRRFVTAISAIGLAAITVISPLTEQVAELAISPSSALDRKLDDTIVRQADLQQQQLQMHATFLALAKWVVECEMAERAGSPMPKMPAPVQLILVQDEIRTTSP